MRDERTQLPADESQPDVESEAAQQFLSMLFVPVFEKAILEASDEMARDRIAARFADSPVVDLDQIKKLFGYVAHVQFSEHREADAATLLRCVKILSNAFLARRTEKHKNGISVQYVYKGSIIQSIGHALNEGVTQLFTNEVMADYLDATGAPSADRAHGKQISAGTYAIEVAAASRLVELFGQAVGRAYFGSPADLESLSEDVDAKLGPKSFVNLLMASDRGSWREVFALLTSLESKEDR